MKYILMVIMAVAFVLGQFARLQLGNVGITLLDSAVVLFILIWVVRYLITRKTQFSLSESEKIIGGFIISGLIGLALFSRNLSLEQIGISSLYLVRLLCYLCLFYVVKDMAGQDKKKLVNGLVISGAGIVGIGFIQYLFYQSLGNLRYLGWDEHLYRLFSTFLDPNFAGAFFALFLLMTLEVFLTLKSTPKRILAGSLVVLTFAAELLTYSRTGFIMLLVGLGVFLLSMAGKKITMVILLCCIVFFLAAANSKIEGLNPLRVVSSEARLESAREAVSIISKYPLFGVGYNAYRYAQVQMGLREESPQVQSHADAGTDNSYLFILATTGIAGGVFFSLWMVRVLKDSWDSSLKGIWLGRTFFASLIAVLCGSLFLNILFYPMILGWLVVEGAIIRSRRP